MAAGARASSFLTQLIRELTFDTPPPTVSEDKLADDVDVAILWSGETGPASVSKNYTQNILPPVCSSLLLTGEKPLKTPEDLANTRYCTMPPGVTGRPTVSYRLNHINVQQGPIFSRKRDGAKQAAGSRTGSRWRIMLARTEIEAGRLVSIYPMPASKNVFYLVCRDSRRTGKIAAFRRGFWRRRRRSKKIPFSLLRTIINPGMQSS